MSWQDAPLVQPPAASEPKWKSAPVATPPVIPAAKPGKPSRQDLLDVFDPKDDGGPVPVITSDREVRVKPSWIHAPQVQPPSIPAQPAAAPAQPEAKWQAAPVAQPAAPAPKKQEPIYLQKVEDATINPLAEAGRQLISPFLSDEQRQILTQKGLLPPRAQNVAQAIHQAVGPAATMLTAGLSGPIQPLLEPQIKALEHKAALSPATEEKIQAGMDIASLAVPGIKPGAIGEAAASAGKGIEKTLSPTTLTPESKAMETIIREKFGEASRSTAKNEALLMQNAKAVADMTPEDHTNFYNEIENAAGKRKKAELPTSVAAIDAAEDAAIKPAAHPNEAKMAQIEAAADAGQIPREQANAQMEILRKQMHEPGSLLSPAIQAVAKDTKQIMSNMEKRLRTMPGADLMTFVDDYFPHIWKNPEAAKTFAQDFVARQGSAMATKKRVIPTIEEGRAAGLELADPNPVRTASKYITQTNNFIASREVFEAGKKAGYIKYAQAGRQPEGWVELTGRQSQAPFNQKAYAPEAVARVYNNYYSKGFGIGEAMTPYEALRKVTAANTMAELSLSGYHALTITAQNIANDISRAVKNAAMGDIKGVTKAVKSATVGQIPGIKGGSFEVGNKFIKQYKGLSDYGIDMESVVEHFEKGGGKLGQERLYRASEKGGFFEAAKRGELKDVFNDLATEIKSGPVGASKAAINVLSKAAEDVAAPLFQYYIPRVKAGAFANLMEDWVRQNPGASEKAISDARKHFVDLVDDRYGEMNMDNIFWNRYLKQTGALLLRAQGWDVGLVRQAGGGVLDAGRILNAVRKGEGFDKKLLDRPIYLASTVMTTAMINAAYQYMKTGQPPQDIKDLILPRTGGTSKGKPERVAPIGHAKELLHMTPTPGEGPLSGLAETAYSKIATFPKNVYEDISGTDWTGRPVDRTFLEQLGHVAGGFAPFSMSQQLPKGSAISPMEHFMGLYPAGMKYTDPDRLAVIIRNEKRKKETEARRRNVKAQKADK